MTFKSILTFHALEEPTASIDPVLEFAQTCNSHIDIIVLGSLISPPVVLYDVAPAAHWMEHNREVAELAEQKALELKEHAASKGVSASVISECDYPGNLERTAARYSLCSDVHVATKRALGMSDTVKSALNGTLLDAGTPFMILPDQQPHLEEMKNILVAWNGRAEAAKAIRYALPFLKKAARVNIAVIDPVAVDVGEDPGSDLAAYLSRHEVKVIVDVLASGGLNPGEKLLQRARDINADLLVMGGYGHTKLRQWLLGGTTYEILATADIPVFMVH